MKKRSRKPRLRLYDPPRIKHCVQLGPPSPDCGVACMAMLGGCDYTTAWLEANTVAERWERWGLSSGNMVAILRELTEEDWRFRRLAYPRPSLAGFTAWPSSPCVVIIRDDSDRKGHLIVFAPPRWLHDPALHKRYRVEDYMEGMEASVRVIGFIERVQTEPDDAA